MCAPHGKYLEAVISHDEPIVEVVLRRWKQYSANSREAGVFGNCAGFGICGDEGEHS
jgi:hypothetical protein